MASHFLIKPSYFPNSSCVLELNCPNTYYAYPNLLEIEAMPDNVKKTMEYLWKRSIHAGRKVRFLEFFDVFIAKEGLVFDMQANLIAETRTYHSDDEISEGAEKVRQAIASGSAETFKKFILAKSRGATNYGHFVLEMLPRAWLARKCLHVDDWPILIHRASPELVRVTSQALNAIGVGDTKIFASDENPIFVKHVIVADGLTNHSEYLSPFVMQCLDEISASIDSARDKKIYASRGQNPTRDFLDEPVIAQKLADAGFTNIFSGTLDFQSQIEIFKSAECVTGVMGASLANIAFCNPGTPVFCFMPSSASEVLFWMIAQARRLNYYEIRCAETGPQIGPLPWDRLIRIDPDQLVNIVTAI